MNHSKKGYLTAVCILLIAVFFILNIKTFSNLMLLPLYLIIIFAVSAKLQGRYLQIVTIVSAAAAAAGDIINLSAVHYSEYIYYVTADLALPLISYQFLIRLRNAEKKLQEIGSFSDESPRPVMRISSEGRVLYSNKASLEMLPASVTAVGESIPEEWLRKVNECLNNSAVAEYKMQFADKPYLMQFVPVSGGEYINIYGLDVTESNKAEEALQAALEKLKFHIENSPLAYVEFDNESRVIHWSKTAEKIFGWSYEEVVGKRISDLKWVYEDDAEVVRKLNCEMVNARQSSNLNKNRNYTKDGRIISCEWYNSVLFDPDGALNSIFSLVLDVTERVHQQERIKSALHQLEQTNNELENFTYIASHDLQEPLRMVSAYTELLERKYGHILDNNGRQYLSYAGEAARRMQLLIRDLLHYTRISSRDKVYEETDTFSLICNLVENMRQLINESCAKINHGNLPVITADPVLIKILFQHLISNAIKFRGNNRPDIYIEAVETENDWLFSVKDNGIGIAREYHDKIFVIFQRLHTRDKFPGTGMGLSICRRIVEQHGGKIWVESNEREGSKFFFTISKQPGSLRKLPQ